VDAIVLVLANVDFMNWVRKKLDKSWKSNSNETDSEANAKLPVSVSLGQITGVRKKEYFKE
jgi:hypothetical protein